MLRCVVLCCVALRCVVLCSVAFCCVLLCCAGPLQALRVLNVSNALAAILMLVLLGLAASTSSRFIETHRWKERGWALATEALHQADLMTDDARAFVQFGDTREYNAFWDLLKSGQRERTVEQQKALGLTEQELALVEHAYIEAEHLALTEEIAMKLTVQAFGLDFANHPEIKNLTWNFANEANPERQQLKFVTRPMWYTNNTYDMMLPPAQQALLARNLMFDLKYEYDRRLIRDPLDEFYRLLDERGLRTIHGLQETVLLVANLLAGATMFFLLSSICLVVYLVQKLLDYRAESSLDPDLQKLARQDFGNTKRGGAIVALVTAFFLYAAVCGFAIFYLVMWTHYAEDLHNAATRNWSAPLFLGR